jgi:hypothetical protein
VSRSECGDRIRVYRRKEAGLVDFDETEGEADPRDYDVEYYVRQLRETFAARLARALRPDDFDGVFADPDQLSLLPPSFETMRPILTRLGP